MSSIRTAAVAGAFYPSSPVGLGHALDQFLSEAGDVGAVPGSRPPKLLVVPHAGYVYSGAVAASAYARLAGARGHITRVVLLGPAHRVALRGLAAPTVQAFETPLGSIVLDADALRGLAAFPQVRFDDDAHALEHSLEVQLPFLQRLLGSEFLLVPLAVGDARPDEVDEVLEQLWGGDETLIVISSDLSHYLPYVDAKRRDSHTLERVLALDEDIEPDEACGARALNGAIRAARRHGLTPHLLDARNSGDTAGDRRRVVGYAALAFDAPVIGQIDDPLALGQACVIVARNAIAGALHQPRIAEIDHPALDQPGACFVTLHGRDGALRGCIGRLEPDGDSLRQQLSHNARAAAFHDSRFSPLTAAEWPGLRIEVSLLGPLTRVAAATEEQALAAMRPGIDGLVLSYRGARGTFLPQVWEQLPAPRDFLAALRQKAGLPADFWSPEMVLQRYEVSHHEGQV